MRIAKLAWERGTAPAVDRKLHPQPGRVTAAAAKGAVVRYLESDATQIGPGAWIEGDAVVAERAVIGVNAHVGRRAVIGRNAVIGPYANVGDDARVQNGARVPRETKIAAGEEYHASTQDLRRLGLAA